MDVDGKIAVATYIPTDTFFGAPYIDSDEWRESPLPHRHVHGGFKDTDTRFTFYFPTEDSYDGRLFHPLEGAHAGHEDAFGGPMGDVIGGLVLISRLGGYMIESNSGHIGDDIDPRGGDDPTLYGHRASVETARFSKHVAAQVYGAPPHHAYVWGGSGGGRRSPLCLEYGTGVYDGALPFMGGGEIAAHGVTTLMKGAQVMAFASMFNVQRLLRRQAAGVIDAMRPGGSGDPYAGLTTHQREELANLYQLGYPRGDEFMIFSPMGQIWLWSSIADRLATEDAEYFTAFWTQPGYVGHDAPDALADDILDVTTTVSRVVTGRELLTDPAYAGPEYGGLRVMASLMSAGPDLPMAIEVEGLGDGYRLGAGLQLVSGKAKGRQLYCMGHAGNLLSADGVAEANLLRFRDVEVGDEIHVDNRRFLAFCYYYRHHLMDEPAFDFLRPDGRPIYPQSRVPTMSPLMGVAYSGQYEGKLLWVHHTHDASLWPPQGLVYEAAVRAVRGPEAAAERFRLRWTENAEHIPPAYLPSAPDRATSTWLIDYLPVIEQSLLDLVAWVEQGIEPAGSHYEFRDGRVVLPATATERGGIQPVVSATVDGGERAEVPAGTAVTLRVDAEVPPGAGTIVAVEWDLDGSGAFADPADVIGTPTAVSLTRTHAYPTPGTRFATARVWSHRDGDRDAVHRRIPNVASVRIVVT
ncbi:tannase/feruloyl esterase family alpha/beta hydrolase [Frankia gtarii]|uniref:tannase/feruloyl esterase family alpha/beta hydrolase n=1 Tax=Frankia gtarii TaxID=2950102 RepID=UPI0021C169FA|nr:tannase/feruloyl esterase family alpha/beta hydrolase [Frankia gtarii]